MRVSRHKFKKAAEEARDIAEKEWNAKGGQRASHVETQVDRVVRERWGDLPHDQQEAIRSKMMEEIGYEPRKKNAIPPDLDFRGGF